MLWNYDVSREMERMRRDMDAYFGNMQRASGATTYPLINVYDGSDEIIVTAELPGMAKDKVNITFADGALTLSGALAPLEMARNMTAVRQERSSGEFEKAIQIPSKIGQEKIAASFENGILTVTLPKSEEAKPKTITIEAI